MTKRSKSLTFILITIVISIGIAYFGLKLYIEKAEQALREKAQKENILEGIEVEPVVVKVDYSKKIADGSPLVFGGNHMPNQDHEDAWLKIKDIGFKSIRRELYLENELPENISLDDYKNNINDIKNPSNWNIHNINERQKILNKVRSYGMENYVIMAYSPSWLTYSETPIGVPKDWSVYEDIIKKIYKLHRNEIDYIEIWNEPSLELFLDLTNSNMTREQAYTSIFLHAAKAIREVDNEFNDGKKVPIGGPVGYSPADTELLEALLENKTTNSLLNFVSYHNYESDINPNQYRYILSKYNRSDLPIFVSEWNYSQDNIVNNQYKSGNKAISYTSSQLINFLRLNISGASYFVLFPMNREQSKWDNLSMGFYNWNKNYAELLPQAKSWRLLSKSMGLGKGKSIIVESSVDNNFTSLGFENAERTKGTAVVSNTENVELMEFDLRNTGIVKRAKIDIYVASPDEDGGNIIETRTVYPENGNLQFRYLLPENSVLGIKIYEEKEWYDIFEPIIRLNQPKKEIPPV